MIFQPGEGDEREFETLDLHLDPAFPFSWKSAATFDKGKMGDKAWSGQFLMAYPTAFFYSLIPFSPCSCFPLVILFNIPLKHLPFSPQQNKLFILHL